MATGNYDIESGRKGLPVSFTGGEYVPPAGVRGLYVGGAGNVQLELVGDAVGGNVYHNIAVGVIHSFQIRRIVEAGTTASNMRVLF